MTLVDLTFLQFQIIALIDSDQHRGLTFDDVKSALRSGQLFDWLQRKFPEDVDISFYQGDRAAAGAGVQRALLNAADALDGRERKKTGVEHSGLCLLAVLLTEVIQRREWIDRRQA